MIIYFTLLEWFIIIIQYLVAFLCIVGILILIVRHLVKDLDFASIVGYLIILIKILAIYVLGLVILKVSEIFTIVLFYIIKFSLVFTKHGSDIYSYINILGSQILRIIKLPLNVFYHAIPLLTATIIYVIVMMLLLVFYCIYKIILALGPLFSWALNLPPIKELMDEGVFDFFDWLFFGGKEDKENPIGNTIVNNVRNQAELSGTNTVLIEALQKKLNERITPTPLSKESITKSGIAISSSCRVEKYINYKLDMIEKFSNNNTAMETIEENLKLCLLNNFTHNNPKISMMEKQQNKLENSKQLILCTQKAEIEKGFL
jgi:hypothetical protein